MFIPERHRWAVGSGLNKSNHIFLIRIIWNLNAGNAQKLVT